MYALKSKTISSVRKGFKAVNGVDVFDGDDVNNPPKKKAKFKDYVGYKEGNVIYEQCNQNLWFEVGKELKPKMTYKQWCKENGVSITPQTNITNVEHSYWVYEEVRALTEKFIDLLAGKYFKLMETDKQVYLLYQYLNAMCDKINNIVISNEFGAYEVSGLGCYVIELQNKPFVKKLANADVSNEVGKYINEVRYTLRDFNDTYQLITPDQVTYLNFCEYFKKGYIINNVSKKEANNKVLTESVKQMKSVNGKNKTERMINKPLKYMGLVVKDNSSNKHMYAEIESGDFNKYAYFQVVEEPSSFTQTLPSGKKIDKLVFHIDNFDDGHGHDAIFVPAGMSLELVNGDVTEPCGYLVAFERNQGNNEIIKKLEALNDGCDSVITLTEKNIKGLEYHY